MSIYQTKFVPTYLYVKRHNKTGLKYFGKTTSKNPIKYPGNGKYWSRHLEKHGNDVTTLWFHLYTDKETLVEEAISFSKSHNVVESDEWANLKIENGIDGGAMPGHIVTELTKKKIGSKNRGRKMTKEFNLMRKNSMREQIQNGRLPWNKGKTGIVSPKKGKKYAPLLDAHKDKISQKLKGKAKPPRTKEHSLKISKTNTGRPGHPQTEEAKRLIGLNNSNRKKMLHRDYPNSFKMIKFQDIESYKLNGWFFVGE